MCSGASVFLQVRYRLGIGDSSAALCKAFAVFAVNMQEDRNAREG